MNVKYTRKELTIGGIVIAIVAIFAVTLLLYGKTQGASAPAKPAAYAVGDDLIDGPFVFTITDVERDGQTVTLYTRVKNTGKQAETLYRGSIRLRDASGNLYEHDSDSVAKADLNPGLTTEGKITFQVPEDADGLEAAINSDVIQVKVDKSFGNKAKYKTINLGL